MGTDFIPAPIEFFHESLMEEFHKLRHKKERGTELLMDGQEFNNLIAISKMKTIRTYSGLCKCTWCELYDSLKCPRTS